MSRSCWLFASCCFATQTTSCLGHPRQGGLGTARQELASIKRHGFTFDDPPAEPRAERPTRDASVLGYRYSLGPLPMQYKYLFERMKSWLWQGTIEARNNSSVWLSSLLWAMVFIAGPGSMTIVWPSSLWK